MSVALRLAPPGPRTISVEVAPAVLHPPDEPVERRWRELCQANPRLFDGPILALESLDLEAGLARCRRDSYKRLAVQPDVPTGVEQLSVTGVIIAGAPGGADHVLLGRRGSGTRVYGGMWELAPSGGIDPPAPGVTVLSWDGLIGQIQAELETETGLAERIHEAQLVCIATDTAAGSADLVVRAALGPSIDDLPTGRGNWEYSEVAWLPIGRVRAFAAREPVIGTSLEVMSLLGWR